jgi:hypothetical protein
MEDTQTVPRKLIVDEKHKVSYCIPLWLRDEQIKQSIARVTGRIKGQQEKRPEPIAVVCFGPSLNDTWEEIKNYKYVISGSGSHKFLIDHGIIPTWHVEVDPRAHKAILIGTPHKDVEYLIASACHKAVFDLLEGFNVKLWHIFDSEEEGLRTLPRNEWAITGGCNVGLRQMTIARFFGFTDLHVFGMDGCYGKSGNHAAAHPNQAKEGFDTEYGGITYKTAINFLECAKQTFHELNMMPDVKATFHGEGLVQAMAKDYKPKPIPKGKAMIAINKPELISASFRDLNAKLHVENLAYGVGGGKEAPTVIKLCETLKTTSVLDYGCGKGYLAKAIPFPIWEYDPAIPGKDQSPRPADIVVCADVLEHIEPEKLFLVMDDLRRCVKAIGYFVIHMGPAQKSYADGRNTHLIQHGKDWWEKKLAKFFKIGKISVVGPELHVVVAPQKLVQK